MQSYRRWRPEYLPLKGCQLKNGLRQNVEIVFGILIIVAITGALGYLPQWLVTFAFEFAPSVIAGLVTSAIAGQIVEAFTGNFLKKIF